MVPSGYERKRTPLQHSSNASTILSQLMKSKKIYIKNLCYGDVNLSSSPLFDWVCCDNDPFIKAWKITQKTKGI